LGVVVLNWNNGPDTVACVRMVQRWNNPDVRLWVVDNASQDGSAELIAQTYPGVPLIRSDFNRGFGGGCNLGIAAALDAGSEMVLLLNNDATLERKSLDRLQETLCSQNTLGIVGPVVRDRERPERVLSAGGRDIARHLISHLDRPPVDQTIYAVDYVPGTVSLIKAELLRRVGLLDESYFFGVEMVDLCARARRQGFVSAVDARAVAFHSVARSSSLRERLHVYYVIRNRLLYIRKANQDNPLRAWGLLLIWIAYSLFLWMCALVRGNSVRARAIRLGLQHYFIGTVGGQNELVLRGAAGECPEERAGR
jgi:GT2 family glycosyltransferase